MREVFETRWARWHRCATYEEAVSDPITRRLLALTVVHAAARPTRRVKRARRG